jgi:hypothetical protein
MRVPTLYQFFRHQLQHAFARRGIAEPGAVDYISDMLARFAETRLVYAIQDSVGRPLEHIVDMLEQRRLSQVPERGRRDLARERLIVRHIGEYTLFMSGIFRERVQRRGELAYYVSHGSSAYWQCADYESSPSRRFTFRYLHHRFSDISDALDGIRREQLPLSVNPNRTAMLSALWRV